MEILDNGFILKGTNNRVGGTLYWDVICSCGKDRSPMRRDSALKHTGRCTCITEVGTIFGKLTYIGNNVVRGRRSYCDVMCTCGKVYCTRVDSMMINIDGCGSCPNKYVTHSNGDILLDISTTLHQNLYTLINKEVFDKISMYKWYAVMTESREVIVHYAQASEGKERLLLHRLITDCPEGAVVDHISGDTLDNRSGNLRVVDHQSNGRNKRLLGSNTSGVVGVNRRPNGRWRAYITVDNVQLNLGTYEDKEDAISVRKDAELKYNFHENHGRTAIGSYDYQKTQDYYKGETKC